MGRLPKNSAARAAAMRAKRRRKMRFKVQRRETDLAPTLSWRWPLFTFTYMTALAYVGALVVYQVARLI